MDIAKLVNYSHEQIKKLLMIRMGTSIKRNVSKNTIQFCRDNQHKRTVVLKFMLTVSVTMVRFLYIRKLEMTAFVPTLL